MEPVTVGRIDVIPEADPYQRQTRGISTTELKLDPDARRVWAEQEYRDNSQPMVEYLGRRLVLPLGEYTPDGNALKAYLEGDGQELLARICDGHDTVWDGHNHRGQLDRDGEDAWAELERALLGLPESEYSLWWVDDWLNGWAPADAGLTPESTDAEIAAVVAAFEDQARGDLQVLEGDLEAYIRGELARKRD